MDCILTCRVYDHDRRDVEDVEGKFFETADDVVKYFAPIRVKIYSMSEFVDACNNEEIDLNDIWMTYIHIR